jgi:transcriptional regulator with XRE-family HTH domain
MTLNEFRLNKGLSYAALAHLLGVKHATIAKRWCAHSVVPGKKQMQIIRTVTLGAVQPNDFYD